jgi:hypothetical protein
MIWAPYLLNFFLDDYKDAHDLGTEFHYSWIITLISFMGWKEPRYVVFCTRPKPNQGVRYFFLKDKPESRIKMKTGPSLKDTYVTYKNPSPRCGESHQKLSHDMGTSTISKPHDTQYGYRKGSILISSG